MHIFLDCKIKENLQKEVLFYFFLFVPIFIGLSKSLFFDKKLLKKKNNSTFVTD